LETDGKVINPETGTPQGGIVSPILANVYLHYALDLWFDRVVKRSCRGKAVLVRYADDWVCAFEHEDDAERFYQALPKRLEKFGLEVAQEKTNKLLFSRRCLRKGQRFIFVGFEFYWAASGLEWKAFDRIRNQMVSGPGPDSGRDAGRAYNAYT
jgi:hypothetical protein